MAFCPSCGEPLAEDALACTACGFSMTDVERVFGPVPRHRASLNDPSGIFTHAQDVKLQRWPHRIRNRFPQVAATCYIGKMPDCAHALAYGTWLLNRCRFTPGDSKLGDNFSVLLFIDPNAKQASFTTGYGLEEVLPVEALGKVLDTIEPLLRQSRWFDAIQAAWRGIYTELELGWKRLHKTNPE